MEGLTLMPTPIPSRLSQAAFNRVAHIWFEAITKFPKPCVIAETEYSFNTLARLIRDARIAKNRYGWPLLCVDEKQWSAISPTLAFYESGGQYFLGPRQDGQKREPVGKVSTEKDEIVFTPRDELDVDRFFVVLNGGCIKIPNLLMLLTKKDVASLENQYPNIGFAPHETKPNHWYIVT